jgi:hypothetical protein
MRGEAHETNDPVNRGHEREVRVGERVSMGGRVGVVRYVRGAGAVVRFDDATSTKVVPLRRLVPCNDERAG